MRTQATRNWQKQFLNWLKKNMWLCSLTFQNFNKNVFFLHWYVLKFLWVILNSYNLLKLNFKKSERRKCFLCKYFTSCVMASPNPNTDPEPHWGQLQDPDMDPDPHFLFYYYFFCWARVCWPVLRICRYFFWRERDVWIRAQRAAVASVADPWCLSWIPDPTLIPSRIPVPNISIPDPHQRI